MLFFEAQNSDIDLRWILNNQTVGTSTRVSWKPKKGKYILSLVDNKNRVIDSVRFEIR